MSNLIEAKHGFEDLFKQNEKWMEKTSSGNKKKLGQNQQSEKVLDPQEKEKLKNLV